MRILIAILVARHEGRFKLNIHPSLLFAFPACTHQRGADAGCSLLWVTVHQVTWSWTIADRPSGGACAGW
jgi:folate-dependent phosphoribosylglycinamide formyltransferase PurN